MHTCKDGDHAYSFVSTEVRGGPNQGGLRTGRENPSGEIRVSSPHLLGLSLFLPALIAAFLHGRNQGSAIAPVMPRRKALHRSLLPCCLLARFVRMERK